MAIFGTELTQIPDQFSGLSIILAGRASCRYFILILTRITLKGKVIRQ
jgi:hypothetical protein